MLYDLFKRTIVCFFIFQITQAVLQDRNYRIMKADTPLDPVLGKEVRLGELRMKRDSESLALSNVQAPNPTKSLSGLDELRMRRNSESSVWSSVEVPNPESQLGSGFEEPILNAEVYNTANPPPSGYEDPKLNEDANSTNNEDDTKKECRTKYCFWYDNEKKKEHKIHNGTHWSGNGCKLFYCKNGVILPDPSCCEIATLKHGISLNYTLYQNRGEWSIKACEVMVCNSGLIKKVKRIPGCCAYDKIKSMEDGESWWASPKGPSDENLCIKGTCNKGIIDVKKLEEGEMWGNGCSNYICEDSTFQMNKLDLPGSCTTKTGNCITNGTTVKLWDECKGLKCVNGKLFKGFLPECSTKDKLLYKAYDH